MDTRPTDWVHTDCLFCREPADRVLYPVRLKADSLTEYTFSARRARKREHYQIVFCKTCGLVRSDPILDERLLARLYQDSQFCFSEEEPLVCRTYLQLMERLKARHSLTIDSLLEIGCSTGFFLDAAVGMGVRAVTGFEPSRDCAAHARPAVRDRIINDVYRDELLGDRKFDLICGFHVFDHLRGPLDILKSAKERLTPAGHVLIVCHNVKNWTAAVLGEHSPIFDVEHVYLFSPGTMARLITQAGLRVVEIGPMANTYPLKYWLRLLPGARRVLPWLPRLLGNLPVRLAGGNLFALARQ